MEKSQFISFKNSTVFYRVRGEGKAVVLIHGFAEDGSVWNETTKKLQDHFKVIVPDIPGSGKSAILENGASEISIDDYAEAIIAVLKNESINNCTVIGHSMGGYIALAIAEKYPEILNGLGLFHSTAFPDNEERKQTRLKSIAFIQTHDANSFLKTSIPGLFGDKFKREHANVVEEFINTMSYFNNDALIQYHKVMMERPDRMNVLQTIKVPTLFIIGEKDQAVSLEQSLLQCHAPSQAEIHILAGVAHMGMFEESELCNEIIVSFLSSI
jgi:pimeloyl-ACP methyl ester carboxylesterase